ncbi:MAG: acetolactate decarboxylase [Pseudonocardiaceae bacterium]
MLASTARRRCPASTAPSRAATAAPCVPAPPGVAARLLVIGFPRYSAERSRLGPKAAKTSRTTSHRQIPLGRLAFDPEGVTCELSAEHTTPYAILLPFRAGRGFDTRRATMARFEQQLALELPLANRIWALRIHGHFDVVSADASGPRPYRPLAEVFATYHNLNHHDVEGTLVGSHYHFRSDDHSRGGHVVDFTIHTATVQTCEATSYTIELPRDPELDRTPFH